MWEYYGEIIDELPEDVVGFVYVIYYEDKRKYIGKKLARTIKTLPPLKGYKRKRKKEIETKWREYEGSHNKENLAPIVKKEIIALCTNKRTMTYVETKLLFLNNVLETNEFINSNISGLYYENCLDGLYFNVDGLYFD